MGGAGVIMVAVVVADDEKEGFSKGDGKAKVQQVDDVDENNNMEGKNKKDLVIFFMVF